MGKGQEAKLRGEEKHNKRERNPTPKNPEGHETKGMLEKIEPIGFGISRNKKE